MASDSSKAPGLSDSEAAARLAAEGFNELPAAKRRGMLAIALGVAREPMFLLLVAASTIYLVLGDLREALILLASIVVVMAITIYQTRKTELALEALRDLSSPRALVVRGGVQKRIAGREVVRGDILMLKEGDRVPADAVLLSANDLRADESLLTGESVPVGKSAGDASARIGRPGGEDLPFVYSGTLLVQGHGVAQVAATGPRTEFGKIGKALQTIGARSTRLQQETAVVVRRLAAGALALSALVALIYGLTRGVWLEGFLAGVTLAMAILPRGVSGSPHRVPCAGSMAHIPSRRADAAHARSRNPGLDYRAVRRQDRHSHVQPYGGKSIVRRRIVPEDGPGGRSAAAGRVWGTRRIRRACVRDRSLRSDGKGHRRSGRAPFGRVA